MRRSNQFYFGYFVGLSIFVLLSLVTASEIHRPVFGASLIVILTIAALCMIVILIYNTIDQMRPTQIVRAIHHHILQARVRELAVLTLTRRRPVLAWPIVSCVRSNETGHIVSIDVKRLQTQLRATGEQRIEVEFSAPIGRYLAFGDPLATVRANPAVTVGPDLLDRIRRYILDVVEFDDARNLRLDASYGINQLATIAWTSGSTAKSNPAPVLAVIQSLRDILARWSSDGGEVQVGEIASIVIEDVAPAEAFACLESIILVSSESMQAQTLAAAIRTLTILVAVVPLGWKQEVVDMARRLLSSLGEHVLTSELENSLSELSDALIANGFPTVGEGVRDATRELAKSLGKLNSRSTRVPR